MLALLLSILYHDTGNIHGRVGHEETAYRTFTTSL